MVYVIVFSALFKQWLRRVSLSLASLGVRLSDGWHLAHDGLVLTFRREEGNFFHRNSILGLSNGVSMRHLQRDVADILAPLLDAELVLIKELVETRLSLFLDTLEPIIFLSRNLVGRPYSMDGSRRWDPEFTIADVLF